VLLANMTGDAIPSIVFSILACIALGLAFGTLNAFWPTTQTSPAHRDALHRVHLSGVAFAFHKTSGGYIPEAVRDVLTASWGPLSVLPPLRGFHSPRALHAQQNEYGRYVYALGGNEEVLGNAG